MAIIKIETPNGVQQVEIAGNSPTAQEVEAIKKQFFGSQKTQQKTQKAPKDPTNKVGAFAKGFKGAYELGNNPLKKVGKMIGDKVSDKVDAYEKDTDPKDIKQAMQKFRSTTGIKNPQIAAQALQRAADGEMLKPQERKELAPLLAKLSQSLDDQTGQQRILQLFRQSK